MTKWTYSTEASITVKVEFDVEADTKDQALELAGSVLPLNLHDGARAVGPDGWKGSVTLQTPNRGPSHVIRADLRCGKITSVQGTSGGEKIRKAKP